MSRAFGEHSRIEEEASYTYGLSLVVEFQGNNGRGMGVRGEGVCAT